MLSFALKHISLVGPGSPLSEILRSLLHVHETPLSQSAPRDLHMVFLTTPPSTLLKHSAGSISQGEIGVTQSPRPMEVPDVSRRPPSAAPLAPSDRFNVNQQPPATQCTNRSPHCMLLGLGSCFKVSPSVPSVERNSHPLGLAVAERILDNTEQRSTQHRKVTRPYRRPRHAPHLGHSQLQSKSEEVVVALDGPPR